MTLLTIRDCTKNQEERVFRYSKCGKIRLHWAVRDVYEKKSILVIIKFM